MHALDLLTDSDLLAVASGLRSGRLLAPFTTTSMQRFCPSLHSGAVATQLQQLADDGMQPRHMALLVEAILRTRQRSTQEGHLIDLVWTGPETSGTSNRDTGVVVRDLFGSAESEVLVAEFAVYQGRAVFRRLAERMEERPDLRVRLFLDVQRPHTDTSLDDEVLHRFLRRFRTQEWLGERWPELWYDPRSLDQEAVKRSSLHAKCIVVDRQMALVTSANFTEAAQTRNIEVGALIHSEIFAARLVGHFEALAEAGFLKQLVPDLRS
jgi:phosphatidylserine/phosphatidylglycerophosphate/cardiolipin synthase-like enzyme